MNVGHARDPRDSAPVVKNLTELHTRLARVREMSERLNHVIAPGPQAPLAGEGEPDEPGLVALVNQCHRRAGEIEDRLQAAINRLTGEAGMPAQMASGGRA